MVNMSFKDLKIEDNYDTESDDLLNDFYIPVLSEAIVYYRAVGFFSSPITKMIRISGFVLIHLFKLPVPIFFPSNFSLTKS